MWFRNKKSKFARRLAWRVIFIVTLCNLLVISIVLLILFIGFKIQAEMHAHDMMNIINGKMEAMVTSVEVSAKNNVCEIEANLDNPAKVFDTLEKELQMNPHYLGCAVAFEPNYYPSQGRWFEPYVYYRDSTNIERIQLGAETHDYFSQEWYAEGIESDDGYWSEPYHDKDGAKTLLCTYVHPIHDKQGRKIGVFGVDIPLADLSNLVHDQLKGQMLYITFANSDDPDEEMLFYSFIIGRNGQYILHPNKEKILKGNYGKAVLSTPDTLDDVVYRKMLAGESSMLEKIRTPDDTFYISYAPIEHTGWTMAVVQNWLVVYIWAIAISIFIVFFVLIGALIIFLTTRLTIWRATRPLTYLTESVDEVARGNFDTPLPVIRQNDEIRQLRDSFDTMQHSLTNYVEELKRTTTSKVSIENELKIAHDIQMSMLPKTFPPYPERSDIEIYGKLTPAKAVGGDLYDFYIRDEKLFFCIGDVSGKGVPASLVMAVTRSLFRNVSAHSANPEEIVSALNDSQNESNATCMFVTLFVGVLDLPTGNLRYCNAGHNAPYLIKPSCSNEGEGKADSMNDCAQLPVQSNLPVGTMPDFKYTCQKMVICPGTAIFLYTDGLVEAEDIGQHQFGTERLQQTIARSSIHPESLVKTMTDTVHSFVNGAEQSDDLTMMAILYTHQQLDVKLKRQLTLPNDVQETPRLGTFVEEVCECLGFDNQTTMKINLAIEEAVVNVMNYAYPEGEQGEVRISAEANDQRLKFVISDDGRPFDPTIHGQVNISQSAEERSIGGLGIHLMRSIMDSINYERVNDQNVFTLRKKLH
ncbi:MAG: SpoIIE family protein phosphatase [Bacteroidaceae bacterium]|nr:SpoIIE family protein phosphatase [Bacteroidaceae bacterium]